MIPMRASLTIGQDSKSICQANGAEVIDLVLDHRSQTDSAVAWRSETDHIGQTAELSLRHMMERHLARNERTG
jgi:hypothetical protein